ncbi:Glycine-rich domain-containing protein 1 [Cytospora mali]|uniref:Glycine-rich domain-containing protein 1 n=1 Tax=Cytospora mali TaxID=578113 RepID=A0A194UNG6_CYTMA|nr:Glycine-rich domain-containing protein 1 [Valsa mali var. pyri (nom. inval.)]
MTITNSDINTTPSLRQMAKPQSQPYLLPAPEIQHDFSQTARLPSVSECATHLQLLNAIVRLKFAVDKWSQTKNLPEGQAWKHFCDTAVAKFLKWSENVDASKQTIPIPSLDVLMVWHSFMLNPKDYMRYANRVLQGRLGGKGIDWQQLNMKLDAIDEDMPDYLASLSDTTQLSNQQELSRVCPGGFDMVAAIQRQLKYSEKMYNAKYLKSRFADDILTNAIDRYEKFFSLIAENPGVGIAPTQDIDLVWHTHQLWPKSYVAYSRQRTNGRFVNHNDNLDDDTLEESGINGETLFFERFGTPYRICLS